LAHSPAHLKSSALMSFPFPTGIGRPSLTSGGMFRYQPWKECPASSIAPPRLIRSLLWPLSYFSLTGAVCIAPCGELYPNFTGGGAFQSISYFSLVLWRASASHVSIGVCRVGITTSLLHTS